MLDLGLIGIKLRCSFIWDRKKRDIFREQAREQLFSNRVKRYRWGVSYSVFDGEELLEASLKSIRSEVDYINVVYQLQSWFGRPADPKLLPLLHELKEKKLIDELIEFVPDLAKRPGTNERKKRNIGLDYAKKNGCDFFMTMDCDEFYLAEEIAAAKNEIVTGGFSHSYCPIIDYGPKPTQRIYYPSASFDYRPFFSRVRPWSKLEKSRRRACMVDQTKVLSLSLFSRQRVLMSVATHHMLLVRKNLAARYENSSFGGGNKAKAPDLSQLNHIIVENRFNIEVNMDDGE